VTANVIFDNSKVIVMTRIMESLTCCHVFTSRLTAVISGVQQDRSGLNWGSWPARTWATQCCRQVSVDLTYVTDAWCSRCRCFCMLHQLHFYRTLPVLWLMVIVASGQGTALHLVRLFWFLLTLY